LIAHVRDQPRGVVCERWLNFAAFLNDVGERPSWRRLLIRDDPTGELGRAMPDGGLRRGIDGGDRPPGHDECRNPL